MKDVKQSTRLRPLTNQELIDSYDYLSGAASSQDCTGLIPSAPLSEAELDSYEELYPFLPPVPPASDITCLLITTNLIEEFKTMNY